MTKPREKAPSSKRRVPTTMRNQVLVQEYSSIVGIEKGLAHLIRDILIKGLRRCVGGKESGLLSRRKPLPLLRLSLLKFFSFFSRKSKISWCNGINVVLIYLDG
jgi:hypothetical protein